MKLTRGCTKLLLTIALAACLALNVNAQVTFTGKQNIIPIGRDIEYYIDTSGGSSFEQVVNHIQFIKQNINVPDFGLIKSPVWLKIQLNNKSQDSSLVLKFDKALLLECTFYYIENGKFKSNSSGELYPFSSRLFNYHNFIYSIKIRPASTAVYYFKIRSSHQMQMPVFLSTQAYIENSDLVKNILFGIFTGIILVMFFYNLFIYFSVKDKVYLYYVIYILIVGLLQITIEGYGFEYLWPNNVFLATRSFFLLTALVNITGLIFIRVFLHAKELLPKLDKVIWLFIAIYSVAMLFCLNGQLSLSYQLLQFFAGLVSLYILTLSVTLALRGYRPAKFFILAWFPLIAGIIIWILKDVNVISYNTFTNYSITFGSALEVILLSFALADRINIFKAEKEQSQEETLKALKENEKIIQERNTVLETMVKERTIELIGTNEELIVTLSDLKQAQLQLVESEKMASLGQLTAGIAHEINNPINFVTSNINPLKRDIDMVINAFSVIENVGMSGLSAEEKQLQISACKEEIDFDYVKIEIEHLLKGINEGAKRTADIVKGLKIFSRLDEDDLKLADINEGLESTLVIINNSLDNISLKCAYGELPKIYCYPGKLNQVFLNIITNAVYAVKKKFQSGPGGELGIATQITGDRVEIRIFDNGTGMDENTTKKIFEPFFTTKDVGEGTGLGMSIAYNIIKKHDGKIIIDSIPGKGSEFLILLPLNAEKANALQAATASSY